MGIHIQRLSKLKTIPSNSTLLQWVQLTLGKDATKANITLRIINKKESAKLNEKYRHKSGPTNVLSFDYQHKPISGDVVFCAPLITSSQEWAHLVIHGLLHLKGYDHVKLKDAKVMEKKEVVLLKQLGFENPYLENN